MCRKDNQDIKQGKSHSEIGGKKTVQDGEGRLKNLLKKTYLKRWVGDSEGIDAESYLSSEVNSIGFARLVQIYFCYCVPQIPCEFSLVAFCMRG